MATTPRGTDSRRGTKNRRRRAAPKPRPLSRLHKPQDLSLEVWQRELRRQFGRSQEFGLKNIGDQPCFSEFEVANPQSKSIYRVSIRGTQSGENFCSCPDFATNHLGTCKHIEFTLAQLERKRGGPAALKAGYQPPYSEVCLQYGSRREVRFRPGSECPVELARLAARHFGPDGALPPEAFPRFDEFLSKAARFDHELRTYDDVRRFIAEVRDAQRRAESVAQAFPRGIASATWKKLLRVPLYNYQREGALFAARAGRCLIGDEMGLGKTIQAIAAAEIMSRLFGVGRVLVVCPTSLKHQWEREIEKFVGRPTEVIGGLRPRRQQQFTSDSFYKITNYDTVHRDLDLIQDWAPDLVILDEAQRIKNWSTRAARSVKQIASPYCIVLTGTPLENRLEELVSIVQFIDQHRLGPTYQFLHDHQMLDDGGRVVGYRDLDQIGKSLAPVLIRRQKDQVLDQLPGRLDKNFFVPMTPQQRELHEENRETVARVVAKWRRYKFLSEADQLRMRIALQNMRMSCNSTYLLDQQTDYGVKADELATLLEEAFERPGAKAVIFSQWVRTHELIERRFAQRGWEHVLFHGGVPGQQRRALIDRFREDDRCRAFLSTDAGGVGLNLQHASMVVNMDLPWNPAVLEQRIGRVHRLGQKQPVRVVNFVAQGTIEEGMLSLLAFKKSLFAGVLDGGDKDVYMGGSRLTKFVESVEKVTGTIPEAAAPEPVETPAETTPSEAASSGSGASPDARSDDSTPRQPGGSPAASETAAPAVDPWAGLLQTGLAILEQLAAASRRGTGGCGPTGRSAPAVPALVARDEATGQDYLRLPMPPPEVLDQVLSAVGKLLTNFHR